MFVVRPKAILSTPAKVAAELQGKSRYYPNEKRVRIFDYKRDFLMCPVHPEHVKNAPLEYATVIYFAQRNKYGQRKILEQFVPVPKASVGSDNNLTGDKFVVRPLRHSGGAGYRVTGDRLDFVVGQEYISELFPKRREYRIIFVFGQPLIVLRKKPNEGIDADQPWGHENSKFQTINDVAGSRLAGTDVFDRLGAMPVVKYAHIVAADVLYNSKSEPAYSVLELNFCPGLDIDNNRAKVVEAIRGRGQ